MNKNTRVIIVNGNAEVGKGTLVKAISNLNITEKKVYCFQLSTIDVFKEIGEESFDCCSIEKTDESRSLWHNLKMAAIEFDPMFSVLNIDSLISKHSPIIQNEVNLFFVDCREPEEIDKFKEFYKDKCTTLLLTNKNVVHVPNNNADKNVLNYNYDIVVENDGSIEDLKDKAEGIFIKIMKNNKEV